MKIQDVLSAARVFIVLQLDGYFNAIKFQSAVLQNSSWKVKASFIEKGKTTATLVELEIADDSGEVKTFIMH